VEFRERVAYGFGGIEGDEEVGGGHVH
jgi:hypothetical protein